MKKLFIWLLKQMMHLTYIFFINLPKLRKPNNNRPTESSVDKKISKIKLPPDTRKIISFSDLHFGNKFSNPNCLQSIIEKERPDVIILKGDTFDSIESLKYLRKDEQIAINFLRKFGQTTGKRLILIKGDHDWWLTNSNLLKVRAYEKIITKIGNKTIIATHGDEFDKHKKSNGNFLKRIIEPCFYFLDWLSKEHNSNIAKELLRWGTTTPIFIGVLKYSKKLALDEAINLKGSVVLLGHFHFKHKFVGTRKRNGKRMIIKYITLKGGIDAPRQYLVIRLNKKNKQRIRIKTLKTKKAEVN